MKCIKFNLIFILSISFAILLSSCTNKKQSNVIFQETESQVIEVKAQNFCWYYFTEEGFSKIDRPQNVPFTIYLPWTEARRVSSSNTAVEMNGETSKGFAVVNRLGLLCFDNDKITLSKDNYIFDNRTADNLIFIEGSPVFSVYKSSFFNETTKDQFYQNDDSQHLFLIQYDDKSKIAYPLINCNSLTSEKNSEVTDFFWNGNEWVCSIKTITPTRTFFNYISWNNISPILSLTPETAADGIEIKEISFDSFKEQHQILSYEKAPDRIKSILKNFANKQSFNLDVKTAGGFSIKKYENIASDCNYTLSAKALLSQSWCGVLFQDGTFYLEGALPGKYVLRMGKPIAMRLPKLPSDFIYTDFVISGTTLYAAWEQTEFYQISKSGFISIDLNKLLYSN